MNTNDVARIASLIGEPARTAMLLQLMDGRAMTAHELARAAGITPATGSRHLALLVDAQLLQVQATGRHRYHRIASQAVAQLLETIMQVAGGDAQPVRRRTGPADAAMRQARTCYDHLAGRLGVAITSRLVDDGAIVLAGDAARVTEQAAASLGRLGLAIDTLPGSPTGNALCRPCMDWSERRLHLAGRLGAAICSACKRQGWLLPRPQSRALDITPSGQAALRNWMGLQLWSAVTG